MRSPFVRFSSSIFVLAMTGGCVGSIGVEAPADVEEPGRPGKPSPQPMGNPDNPPSPSGGKPPVGGPDRPPDVAKTSTCTANSVDPGPVYIRRLNHLEYDNTVRDLLGSATGPSELFPQQESGLGFANNAQALNISPLLAESYLKAAESLATTAVQSGRPVLAPCDVASESEDSCAKRFISTFGKRAFRRPVEPDDAALLAQIYADGKSRGGTYKDGIQLVVAAVLQSPRFLYRVEFGQPAQPGRSVVALDSWEMATRLSYLLWNSMPDDALFAAAEAGRLTTRAEIGAQVTRMLAHKRARAVTADFYRQWLELDHVSTLEKDLKLFPAWTAQFATAAQQETSEFMDNVTWDGPGDLGTMLAAPYTFVNATLAKFYGIAGQRTGLLGQVALLAAHAKPNQTSPVLRGKFVREQFLCDELPPPPPGLAVVAPNLSSTLTTRERFAQHAAEPACSGCHALMDPLGLGFETFDAIGAHRATENGKPIDATGVVKAGGMDASGAALDISFDGAADLAAKLSASPKVRACMVTKWFRYGFGRGETLPADSCSLDVVGTKFAASGYKVKALLAALTESDAFLFRRAVVPGGAQ